jgi:hypothetical protein
MSLICKNVSAEILEEAKKAVKCFYDANYDDECNEYDEEFFEEPDSIPLLWTVEEHRDVGVYVNLVDKRLEFDVDGVVYRFIQYSDVADLLYDVKNHTWAGLVLVYKLTDEEFEDILEECECEGETRFSLDFNG